VFYFETIAFPIFEVERLFFFLEGKMLTGERLLLKV